MAQMVPSPWNNQEVENLKDCIRLGVMTSQLAQVAVPTRPLAEITGAYDQLHAIIEGLWRKFKVPPSRDPSEFQFTLSCVWDLGKRNKQSNRNSIPLLFPVLTRDQECQLVQLIMRFRRDKKNISAQLMSPRKQGPPPSKYNIQLTPRNPHTEVQMTRFGYNSKLQLTVGKTKKISSIIGHLNKKWKAALGDGVIRLSPSAQSGLAAVNFSWGEEDKCVIVSKLYALLQCRGALVQLDYQFSDPTQPILTSPPLSIGDELGFTPSLEATFSELLQDIENVPDQNSIPDSDFLSALAAVEPIPQPIVIPDMPPVQEYDSSAPVTPLCAPMTPSENSLLMSLPDVFNAEGDCTPKKSTGPRPLMFTPFKSRGSALEEISQDGFNVATRGLEYEGKCRDHWYSCEESVDFSCFLSPAKATKRKRDRSFGSEPLNKKRLL